MSILIGCDPEVFVKNSAGEIVSGIGIIGGSKSRPRPVQDGTLQEDNVLAEIGIIPAASADDFVLRITSVLNQLNAHLADWGLAFDISSSNYLDAGELMHPRAMEFGCEPDFTCYLPGVANPRPQPNSTLRTAGGHVHIGYDTSTAVREDVVKACDILIGLPSIFLDGDIRRMQMYGSAGAYRPKEYGVEYRSPSNFWLRSEMLMRWVFQQATSAVSAATDGRFMQLALEHEGSIRSAIATADKGAGSNLLAIFGVEVPLTAA